jgi:hypothetical protein
MIWIALWIAGIIWMGVELRREPTPDEMDPPEPPVINETNWD